VLHRDSVWRERPKSSFRVNRVLRAIAPPKRSLTTFRPGGIIGADERRHIIRPDEQQQRFGGYLAEIEQSVFWDLGAGRDVWDFDALDSRPSHGPSWFFIVNFPRTGSSIVGSLLNRHPDVYCGDEENVLPLFMTLLGSELFMSPSLSSAVRYKKAIDITPRNMRHLLEAWRSCRSSKTIFGDKSEMYYHAFGPACEAVFPGCKFVLTVRNVLDTLSSYIRQPWAAYLYHLPTQNAFFERLRAMAEDMLGKNAYWHAKAATVEFERLTSRDGFESTFAGVFEHLGVEAEAFDWNGGWTLCEHDRAVGRWRTDDDIGAFLEWFKGVDPALASLLERGDYYFPIRGGLDER